MEFEEQKEEGVILSDRRESKDLGTDFTAYVTKVRRFFDSANAPLRMTCVSRSCTGTLNYNLNRDPVEIRYFPGAKYFFDFF